MSPIEWVLAAAFVSVCGACLWWALRAIRIGHEAGPVIDALEDERDEAIDTADRRAQPLPSSESLRDSAGRELARRKRLRDS